MTSNSLNDTEHTSVYFTGKVLKALNKISNYPLTIVEAPTGYGKTTAIKKYSHDLSCVTRWINVTSESKDIFWADFCDALETKDNVNILKTIEFPQNEKNVAEIRQVIKKLTYQEDTYIVIDNYQVISDEYIDFLFSVLSDCISEELHFILITHAVTSAALLGSVSSGNILNITKDVFEFSSEDILDYFKENGLNLSKENTEKIREMTEGYISAICLLMIDYKEHGSVDSFSSMNTLVDKILWNHLSENEQKCFLILSRIDHFTFKEACIMLSDLMDKEEIEATLKGAVFVRFDNSNRTYYIHRIFINFLNDAFAHLDKNEQTECIIKAATIYEYRDQLFMAYKCYYEVSEWELIYKTVPKFDELYPYINSDNEDFFISLVKECPYEIREKYYYFPIIMCFVLFMYNEKNLLLDYLMNIVYSIEENTELSDREKRNLLGTVYYVRGYTEFNNISVMNQFFKKSLDYSGSPIAELTVKVPFTFGCPSMLNLYYVEGESADEELEELNDCMLNYYKISEGHGKGAEALMKAEILYNRGDFENAEILCHKALYMADGRNQTSITIGTLLMLARISIFGGDYDEYHNRYTALRKKVNYENNAIDNEYINMIDLCESYLHMLFGEKDGISDWLTERKTVESRLHLISMSYANIIYGKWLCLNEKYQQLLGISGEFLTTASMYSNGLPKIYTYIYCAIANSSMGNEEKAVTMLKAAMDVAMDNNFIMPFVENGSDTEDLLEKISMEAQYRVFVKTIKSVHRKYIAGLKAIGRNVRNKENFGLTARETEVAKLAAERYSNKEIAEKLYIAESTVKSNMKIIFSKLNISSRSELSKYF